MKHDGKLDLAVGLSAKSKIWKNKQYQWSELVQRLSEEHKTTETFKEFMAASKSEQLKIKDVGGYVGGYLRNARRNPQNVVHRQVLTLDIDFAHIDFWDDFCLQFDNAAVLHSTHKHHESSPRFRLVIPLSRETTPDEYVAIARKISGLMNIELFDNTTFETNRLMFWPSNPKDVDYYFRFQDGPWVDADEILDSYIDWTDSSLWPTAEKQIQAIKTNAEKQEDPENKKGVIGAFCRAHTITEVLELFLQDEYVRVSDERYTYVNGTTAAGLVIYDDKFAYSHHGTDPSGGKLCNAFDFVRIHNFGHLDEGDGKATKSFRAMQDFARNDKRVRKIIASENLRESKYDFSEEIEIDEDDISWMQELEVNEKSKYLSTANNINLIFANDIRLKGLFKQNNFDDKKYIFGNMPWRKITGSETIKNVDYSGVRNYLESIYGITGNLKIDDSLALEFEKNSYHPVTQYLRNLKWDGVKRADTLLIDYFGAEDTPYTREAMRKMLVGAVARVFNPGCKFDLVLTLVSQQQGTGKSSFFKALGGEWFSDTFLTVQGKEALEQIQGAWIIEMAELAGIRKAEVEAVKHFISKQVDMFRPAYGRVAETYLRQCVFVATTNQSAFLKDSSGNRRFIPVDIHNLKLTSNSKLKKFLENQEEISQVWAEAVHLFRKGERLYLSKEAETLAEIEQKRHSEIDERSGIIENYLNQKLPRDWESKNVHERREFFEDPLSERGAFDRDFVCVAEIWCECLGKEKQDMDRYKTREINDVLRSLDDWQQSKSTKNFAIYGKQRYYLRKLD